MHQVAATYWNQIAKSQSLATEWARDMFPLLQDDLDRELDWQEFRLEDQGVDHQVSAAYFKIMPLLWERIAISNFLQTSPSLRAKMPPLESLPEALLTASRDFGLSDAQLNTLSIMLAKNPSELYVEEYFLGFIDPPGPFARPEVWEEFIAGLQAEPDFRWKDHLIRRSKWEMKLYQKWTDERALEQALKPKEKAALAEFLGPKFVKMLRA
jgi:hypothetical protein